MTDFDDYQQQDRPSWAAAPRALAWALVLGTMKQAVVQAAKEAVKLRFAKLAPPDALPDIARDRGLDVGFAETQASLRYRIANAWEQWGYSGTPYGLFRAFELDGLVNTIITEKSDDASLGWWQFDVRINPPFPWVGTTTADVPQVWRDRIVKLVRKWKPTHAECRTLTINCYGETWSAYFVRRPTFDTVPLEPLGEPAIVFSNIR